MIKFYWMPGHLGKWLKHWKAIGVYVDEKFDAKPVGKTTFFRPRKEAKNKAKRR